MKRENERKKKSWIRQERQRLKTRSDWTKLAQTAFNAYIRFRDRDKPCIVCDSYECGGSDRPGGGWDCGHYRTVGAAPELRFNEDNAHRQCKGTNGGVFRRKGYSIDADTKESIRQRYRANLVKRIGLERVEALEGPHEPCNYSADDLRAIRDCYRDRLRAEKRLAG